MSEQTKASHGVLVRKTRESVDTQLDRVEMANKIYEFVAKEARHAHSRGVGWSIENPTGSLFWHIPYIQDLANLGGVYDVEYDACMHGSDRDKSSKWRTNVW